MKPKKNNNNLWETSYRWLKLCGNKINENYCKEEITTHPDYPALTSLIDFLDNGSMDYIAAKGNPGLIHEFNYPLLAHISQPGQEYMAIISDAEEWEKQKDITQYWSGIVIVPEANAQWSNNQNDSYLRQSLKNGIICIGLCLAGVVVFTASVFQRPDLYTNIFGFLSLTGLLISIFLLGTELGYQSRIVKQVCGAFSEGGCEKVLKSKYARGVLGMTPADASLIYFSAQFLLYLMSCWLSSPIDSLFIFAAGGIAIALWSIYTQAFKLRQWCGLCLGVVTILVLQAIISFSSIKFLMPFRSFEFFMILFIVLSVIFLPIKQLLKTNNDNKIKLAELKNWKLDAPLFLHQWEQERGIDTSIWENDLIIGSAKAPFFLTVACNPYCGPCAKLHKELDNLIENFEGKVGVQIRMLCSPENGSNNIHAQAIKGILQKAAEGLDKIQMQDMLKDWFDWMDLERWTEKWKPNNAIDVSNSFMMHQHWIEQSQITYTPTLFFNGKKIPGRYTFSDFELLIPQLEDIITKKSEDVTYA